MKVYDYLTVATTFCKDKYKDLEDYLWDKFKIANAKHDFYNLPFTPELISKYFKGWKVKENLEYSILYVNEKYNYSIIYHISTDSLIIAKRDNDFNIIKILFPKPLVLNDFIRDCERAEIELEM
jgi:hypothetical protein